MTFSALLLAGGESRRMGRDKATIESDGQPLWARQLHLLGELRPENILVSARAALDWLPDGAVLLLDDPPSRGPLSGVAKALSGIETTHLLVLAIDMPFMTATELGKLLALATKGCGVVPIIDERAEPLAAVYPGNVAEDFEAALVGPDFSLKSIVRRLAATGVLRFWSVPERDAHLYQNWNEPGDVNW